MSAENAWRIAREQSASIAQNACLVPPDGGSPSEENRVMCAIAAEYIMEAPMPPAFRAEVEAEAEELRGMLADMADDLEAYIRADYGWPDVHPAMQRKYERDMLDVEKARALLSRLEAKGESHE